MLDSSKIYPYGCKNDFHINMLM